MEDEPCAAAERNLAVRLECSAQAVAKVPIAGEIAREFELPDSTGVARRLGCGNGCQAGVSG